MIKSIKHIICKIKLSEKLLKLMRFYAKCLDKDLNECFVEAIKEWIKTTKQKIDKRGLDINKALQETEKKLRTI